MMSLFGGGESDRTRSGDLQGFWERWGLGLFALVAIGVALLAAVWIAGNGLRSEDEPASAPFAGGVQSAGGGRSVDGVSSGGGHLDDVVMSGGYEVGADGKLLRPKDAPVPVAPVKPEAMQHETPEGMEAFARYVVELAPYTWMSGETRRLEEVSQSGCEWCKRMIETTDQRQQNGGWVTDAAIDIVRVSQAFEIPDRPHWWHIDLEYYRSPMVSYDGATLQHLSEERLTFALEAIYEDGRWGVYEVGK